MLFSSLIENFYQISTPPQFYPLSLALGELNLLGGFGPPCVFPISKLHDGVL